MKSQFNYSHLKSKDYDKHASKPMEHLPCIICGKECKNPKNFVWEHLGGGTLVTPEEGERLNSTGQSGADLGCQPVGGDCLKKHPELKAYLLD